MLLDLIEFPILNRVLNKAGFIYVVEKTSAFRALCHSRQTQTTCISLFISAKAYILLATFEKLLLAQFRIIELFGISLPESVSLLQMVSTHGLVQPHL